MKNSAKKTKRNFCSIQRIKNAYHAGCRNCKWIYIIVVFPKFVRKSEHDEHDRNRIDCIEHRNRNAENCIEAKIADKERYSYNNKYPLAIAQLFELNGKIL